MTKHNGSFAWESLLMWPHLSSSSCGHKNAKAQSTNRWTLPHKNKVKDISNALSWMAVKLNTIRPTLGNNTKTKIKYKVHLVCWNPQDTWHNHILEFLKQPRDCTDLYNQMRMWVKKCFIKIQNLSFNVDTAEMFNISQKRQNEQVKSERCRCRSWVATTFLTIVEFTGKVILQG